MDYKEKYEKAVKDFKKIKSANKDNKALVDFIEYEYPELKVSEDEEIRYYLINFVKINDGVNLPPDYAKKALAWLEKQKDHEDELEKAYKTADEVQYRRGYEAAKCEFEKQGEQKPTAWSEEDEDIKDTIIHDLKRLGGDIVNVKPAYKAEIDWLKSLKRRLKGCNQ